MKKSENKIFFTGKYPKSNILSGPEYFAKLIFDKLSENYISYFIQYFFDGKIYSIKDKLFSKEIDASNNSIVTLGIFPLIKIYIKEKPDIIHILNYERFPIVFYLLKYFMDVKIIYEVHGIIKHEIINYKKVPLFLRLKDYLCEWVYFKFSTILIFKSNYELTIAKKYYSLETANYKIIPNPLEIIEAKKITYSGEKLIVVYLSNISRKESVIFLNSILFSSEIEAEFLIINYPEELKKICSFKPFITLSDKIPREEWLSLLKKAQIYLLLSSYEPFSISTAEAMCSGCAVIVTKESGIAEFITNGENGYTIHFGDAVSVKKIIAKLISDEKLLNTISENAKNISKSLDYRNIVSMYNNVYEQLL